MVTHFAAVDQTMSSNSGDVRAVWLLASGPLTPRFQLLLTITFFGLLRYRFDSSMKFNWFCVLFKSTNIPKRTKST